MVAININTSTGPSTAGPQMPVRPPAVTAITRLPEGTTTMVTGITNTWAATSSHGDPPPYESLVSE